MNDELEQLGERIAEQAAHLDAAMHRLLADLREFDDRGGWHLQGAASCAHWLAWRVGWDLVTAREHIRVARKLAGFLAIDEALRHGEVSYSKARALLRVATPANEMLLLDHARLMTASQLEKLCRKYALVQRHRQAPDPRGDEQRRYVRRRDTEGGMIEIEAVLHPEEAEMVWTMLNHAATRLAQDLDPPMDDHSAESCDAAQRPGVAAALQPGGDRGTDILSVRRLGAARRFAKIAGISANGRRTADLRPGVHWLGACSSLRPWQASPRSSRDDAAKARWRRTGRRAR